MEVSVALIGRKWKWGAGALFALVILGNVVDDDTATVQSAADRNPLASTVPLDDQAVWVGTVSSYGIPSRMPNVRVDLGGGRTESVVLAHTSVVLCGDVRESAEAAAMARLEELAPVGSTVTVVRGTKQRQDPEFTSYGFVHPSSPATLATSAPMGPSMNETLLVEGLAYLVDPAINLSVLASESVEVQQAAEIVRDPNLSYWPTLVAAYRSAWDGRTQFQSACRAQDDERVVAREQYDELNRLRMGPDGVYGTADDDRSNYKYDDEGNLYIAPPVSSGGGGGGGGGRCHRRWC